MYVSPLLDSVVHFSSSACAGLLAYCSTSITCSRWSKRTFQSRSRTSPDEPVDRSIFLFSLSAALFASIAVHVYIDYYVGFDGVCRLLGLKGVTRW